MFQSPEHSNKDLFDWTLRELATFVAFSRAESKRHYTHDVIAGAAIGIGSSYLFTEPYKGWHIQPDVGHHAFYGILISRSW